MTVSEIRETLVDMQVSLGNIQKVFNKNAYPGAFESYYKKYEPFFMQLEAEFEQSDRDELMNSIRDAISAEAAKRYSEMNRRKKEMFMLQDQLALVSFVFPCILYYGNTCTDTLCKEICASWNETFHMTLKTATYESINAGFKRNWCYITTAVCESLNKPDDCEELTLLRAYRDTYMSASEHGRELISRYYDIAPTIVHKIDRCEDSDTIYARIYEEHLIPCLNSIRSGEMETCMKQYSNMVEVLEDEYMYS